MVDDDDIARIRHMDDALLARRMMALRAMRLPHGSNRWRFVSTTCVRVAADLGRTERHQVALLCWLYRHKLPRGVAPLMNPHDQLSPDQAALRMGCTPTLAQLATDDMRNAR